MKILVTGGSGFIGTNVIEYYLNMPECTVCSIDIATPKIKEHEAVWKNVNLLDRESLERVVQDFSPDYVIHLAARTDLSGNSLADYTYNTIGTSNLIESLKYTRVKKVLFASSMLVCKVGYIPENVIDYFPVNAYGESKVAMEKLIRMRPLPFEWVIVRPTSIWGPWFGIPYRDFFDMIYKNRFFKMGGSSCTKTYGFIENAVQQIDTVLMNKTNADQLYYLGDDPPININNWADLVAKELNKNALITIPIFFFYVAAVIGDILGKLNIKFPFSSFRLKNMSTDNIIPKKYLVEISNEIICNNEFAVKKTVTWLNENFYDQNNK